MPQKRRFKSQGFGPIGEAEAGTKGTEGPVAGDEAEAGGEGMSGDEHVQGGEGATFFPGGGTQVSVGACGGGVPGQNADAQEELIDELGEFCGLGLQGEAKEQFGLGDGRNADLGHGNAAQMLANRRRISSEGVAHAVGIEHETGHAMYRSEETAFLGRATIAGS